MNKQELIKKYEEILINGKSDFKSAHIYKTFLRDLKQLDEPEAGHADEAPRYVKNILARLRELPLHDREVWLKTIMGEFEQDFSRAKWREGYEQGKVEGLIEREKPVVKQFVADWYEENKDDFELNLWLYLTEFDEENIDMSERFGIWLGDEDNNPIQTLVNMHQFGYEVEEEKRYRVRAKGVYFNSGLIFDKTNKKWFFSSIYEVDHQRGCHTHKELEDAGFGWVFDCEGIEIEEAE